MLSRLSVTQPISNIMLLVPMTSGTIDSSKYTGSITYIDVDDSQGFWEFTGSGYAVGSGSFKSTSIDTIADTGTTLIYIPDAVVEAYYGQVSGASYDSSRVDTHSPALLTSLTSLSAFALMRPLSLVNISTMHLILDPISSVVCNPTLALACPFMVMSSSRVGSWSTTLPRAHPDSVLPRSLPKSQVSVDYQLHRILCHEIYKNDYYHVESICFKS